MGRFTADGPRISFDNYIVQAATFEYATISLIHFFVGGFELSDTQMKTVSVLHQEFAGSQHPKPRPKFVAKLSLDLIKIQGQLLVGANVLSYQSGNNFLMRGPKDDATSVAVIKIHEHRAIGFESAAALPQFARLNHRHVQFLGSSSVHLLSDDLLDLTQRPIT